MKKIEEFLKIYPNRNTVKVYRAGIYGFIDCLYGRVREGRQATTEEKEKYEQQVKRYFSEQRDYYKDLISFAAYMNGRSPIGARAHIAGVIEFLSYNEVELTQRQRKQLSTKMPRGKTGRTAEKDIDTETLKKILTHLDLKGKAFVITLASTGVRIGELLQVKLSDVDLTTIPGELIVRGEGSKSGDTRTVFLSSEAKELVVEWLKIRDRYLEGAKNRNKGLVESAIGKKKSVEDDRLFPFSDSNVREIWENALTKAGVWHKDETTGRTQIRIHALRKFFRSQLALSCPIDIVEALMGHEGYLTEAYRRYPKKQMGEYYLKAEHHVMITGTGDIREIQDKLQDTQVAVRGYKDIIQEQAEEMVELRERVDELTELKGKYDAQAEKISKMEGLLDRMINNPKIIEELAKE